MFEDIRLRMGNKDFSKKRLGEEVYDELFANIEKHDEFDGGTIETLRLLAAKDELKKPGKIIEAIKATVIKEDETTAT